MKSKREIEKQLWPLVKPNNFHSQTKEGHAEYKQFQREFQKRLTEQLKHNPITVSDLVFKIEITQNEIERLFNFEFSLDKKKRS